MGVSYSGWGRLSFRDFDGPCYINGHYPDSQCTPGTLPPFDFLNVS